MEKQTELNELKTGDYVKFGRVTFKVKETSTNPLEKFITLEDKDSVDNTSEGAVIANNPSRAESVLQGSLNRSVLASRCRRNSYDRVHFDRLIKEQEKNRQSAMMIRAPFNTNSLLKIEIPLVENQPRASGLKTAREKKSMACRICWGEEDQEDMVDGKISNPLVAP